MATVLPGAEVGAAGGWQAELARPDRAIGSPRGDALLLWGAPPLALALIMLVALGAELWPAGRDLLIGTTGAAIAILTYAHLIAVVPRAYGNAEVLAAHPRRLLVVPVLLVAALLLSPTILVAGFVLAVFWDVHHSAMQTFGLGRLYDMKAGNDPHALRRVDLVLNSALYIGPAAAGASMLSHFDAFRRFDQVGLGTVAALPHWVSAEAGMIRTLAMLAWAGVVSWSLLAYARAARQGYRTSAHKRALLIGTAAVSILAWGLAPPFVAFATVNLFHALQYFAIVWLKEGKRIGHRLPSTGRLALPAFVVACLGFGVLYWLVADIEGARAGAWLAPFVACSLLHFWYDGFIWSVRRKLV